MSIQQKLRNVFKESFQIKRVAKCKMEIIKENKQKLSYQQKFSLVKNSQVSCTIYYSRNALKHFQTLSKFKFIQIKIIMKTDYPAVPPIVYCTSDNLPQIGLKPFRDYCNEIIQQWTAKVTLLDIIKKFLFYASKRATHANILDKGIYRQNELFQIQKIFGWSQFLQTFPVGFNVSGKKNQGFIILSFRNEVIVLQSSSIQNSYLTKDLILISQIVSIFKSKKSPNKILLQIKKGTQKYGFQIISQDRQNLMSSVLDCMKANQQDEKDYASSSSEDQIADQEKQQPTLNIQQIKQSIIVYQSLIDTNMNSQNVSALVQLLKKAIEYYSAIGDQKFQLYLKKLKEVMSNQMTQVLLNSEEQEPYTQLKKQKYVSLIDMF